MTTTGKLIFQMDFARVINDNLKEDGLYLDDIVFVQNAKAFPVSEEDPYTQRVKFIVRRVTSLDDVSLSENAFMIDPSSVQRITDDGNAKLFEKLQSRLDKEYGNIETSD